MSEIELIDLSMISKGGSSFVIVIQSSSVYGIESLMLKSNAILDDILDLTLAIYNGNNTYKLYGKDENQEQGIKLKNMWKDGNMLLDKDIFPENKLHNLRGKKIRATSFEYPPFIYKENQKYKGYEVQLLEDLAQAVNFTFEIYNPSDGLLWGSVSPNGTPTGLIRDMMVIDC